MKWIFLKCLFLEYFSVSKFEFRNGLNFLKAKQLKLEIAGVVGQLLSPKFGSIVRGCTFYPQGVSECRRSITSDIFRVCLIPASLVCATSIIGRSPRTIAFLVGSSGAVSALCRCMLKPFSSLADKSDLPGFATS